MSAFNAGTWCQSLTV